MTLQAAVVGVAVLAFAGVVLAQETRPVPKDSVRVAVPGCSRGAVFTAGARTADVPGSLDVPEGMRLRMNGPKALMAAIKAHEGSMIEITGLMLRGQFNPQGVAIGGGIRISPGPGSPAGSPPGGIGPTPSIIDVEGWRQVAGDCRTR